METFSSTTQSGCDFCATKESHWIYECHPFVVEIHAAVSEVPAMWAACDICHSLIELAEWPRLLERRLSTIEVPVKERQRTSQAFLTLWGNLLRHRIATHYRHT